MEKFLFQHLVLLDGFELVHEHTICRQDKYNVPGTIQDLSIGDEVHVSSHQHTSATRDLDVSFTTVRIPAVNRPTVLFSGPLATSDMTLRLGCNCLALTGRQNIIFLIWSWHGVGGWLVRYLNVGDMLFRSSVCLASCRYAHMRSVHCVFVPGCVFVPLRSSKTL